MDENDILRAAKAYNNPDSEQILGNETVSGYKCVKKEVTSTITVMGTSITSTVILWKSDQFEFPLRTQDANVRIIEFRNIDTNEPSKNFFRRLVGYKRVDSIMAVLGMDLAAMAKQQMATGGNEEDGNNEEQEDPESGSQENPENFNFEGLEETWREVLGENADPEETAKLDQLIDYAKKQLKETNMNEGASEGLWEIIPKRPGDKIGMELKTQQCYQATMGTNDSLREVFNFYEKKLVPQGWKNLGMYIENGMGAFNLLTDQHMLGISWAENPGMDGNYKFFYNIQLIEIRN